MGTPQAVTIRDIDERGILAVDLIHVLRLAGTRASASRWRCSWVECVGPGADGLHAVSDGRVVTGAELIALVEHVDQVIDGEFVATDDGDAGPWLVVRAVDSTEYAVITDDDDLLLRIRATWRDVRESPGDLKGQ
jgi:hypothetical protein